MMTSVPYWLLIASVPSVDDWREGTGLLELLTICIALFLLLLPVCVIRGLFKKRPINASLDEAWKYASAGAIGFIITAVCLVFIIGIPFGILNMIGIAITGKQCAWQLILPGMALCYVLLGIGLWKAIKSNEK